jgi:WD40 repeat protein
VLATLDAPVLCVAVEPGLKWFVAGGDPEGIRVWDSNLVEEPFVPVEGRVNCVAVHGDRLAYGEEDGYMSVISLQTQEKLRTFKSKGAIRALSFSPNGRFLVAGGGDENKMDGGFMRKVWNTEVLIWDGDNAEPQVRDDEAVVYAVAFSPDQRFLAVGDDACMVTLLHLSPDDNATFVPVYKIVESGGVRALSWAPDSQHFAVGGVSATVTVYCLDQAQPAFRTKRYDDWIMGLSFGPRGHSLAVVGYGREAAEVLQLAEAASARPVDPA